MDKKTKIKFHVLAIFVIIIFCFAITPKTLQNDTYYTIAIGEHILENGIDMEDPFSWHEDLPYTYPHWAYDVGTYLVFQLGENIGESIGEGSSIDGFTAIYIMTVILAIILGITIYYALNKICKNELVSFLLTIAMIYLLKSFITARAQLVTYILFVLTLLCIEGFINTKKKRYVVGLIIIPIIIANVHLAVWPFYFVLYLPYVVEYIIACFAESNIFRKIGIKFFEIRLKKLTAKNKDKDKEKIEEIKVRIEKLNDNIMKSTERREKRQEHPYKIILKKNNNVKWLIVIMIVCIFTGLLTPLGDTPYTYLPKTMAGNTMDTISEHLPLTLIEDVKTMVVLVLFLLILIA